MAVQTNNKLGKIIINEKVIAEIASHAAMECYGVIEMSPVTLTEKISYLLKKEPIGKGIKVETISNKVNIDVYVVLKNGVNLDSVKKSLKDTIEYHVDKFTNMRVDNVNIHITGLQLN